MSIDYTTHLGPYVECKTSQEDKPTTFRTCTNKTCEEHGQKKWWNIKFCEKCGATISEVTTMIKANKIDVYHVLEEIRNALMIPTGDYGSDIDLWLPNLYRKGKSKRTFSFDPRDGSQLQEITGELITEEITEFKNQYSVALDILCKLYGSENVTVKWGLVHSIH